MAEPIDNCLIYDVLKDVQARLASLEGIRDEMREGFASLRAHMATQHGDAVFLERRVLELERDIGAGQTPPAARRPGRSGLTRPMRKHDAIRRLREHADTVKAIGATLLYLFGSTARDEASEASDLDLFIDYDEESKLSAIELLRIRHYLSEALQIEADITTPDGLHPLIRDDVVASAERVF